MSANRQTMPKTNGVNDLDTQSEATKAKRMINVKVVFLDNSSHIFQIQGKALGRIFFDKVCKFLNLIESDYFGLEYEDEAHTKYWLDGLKPLCRQVGLMTQSPVLHFCVKFYTPDPVQLEDEYTRYLFSLQVKKDLASGVLQCNDNTAAVMVSYIVQADLGDYDREEFPDYTYLSSYKFVPYQESELEKKVMENHKKHIGQTPAEAELNLLETARRCELYGVRMTAAKDQESLPLNIAVAHLGVIIFQNYTKINTFSWAKIRKLSFKRKKFLIKLHPEGYGYYKDTVEFFFEGRNECKNFWKKCIENHTFFRCTDAKKGMHQKPKFFSRGSSFRYSGRTQVQLSEYVRENNNCKRSFQRSTSLRTAANSPTKPSSGTISPQPVLPVSTSFSCESVSAAAQPSPPIKKLSSSEPATPHMVMNASQTIANGFAPKPEDDAQERSPELVTPDSEQGGYQTPDVYGQDTDDNISHDSYHVTDKEAQNSFALEMVPTSSYQQQQQQEEVGEASAASGTQLSEGSSSPISLSKELRNAEDRGRQIPRSEPMSDKDPRREVSDARTASPDSQSEVKKNGLNGEQAKFHVTIETSSVSSRDRKPEYLNGHSPKSNDDSDNIGLEDTLNGTSNQQSFGVPSYYSESFGVLMEPRLISHKKAPNDKAYFLAKELLMTERTYRRDLEIIDVVFREEFHRKCGMSDDVVELVQEILSLIDPLYDAHCSLLRELEQRMAFWEGKHVKVISNGVKGVGDILCQHKRIPKLYELYVEQLPQTFKTLSECLQDNKVFADFYLSFETLKTCYLPLTSLLLKPLYRLHHYCSILTALVDHYGALHFDYDPCCDALKEFSVRLVKLDTKIPSLVNTVKLMELERSLEDFPSCVQSDRVFIREGCLQKLSKNGNHQCMVFLFSDVLLYAKRVIQKSPTQDDALTKLRLKVRSCLPLRDMRVEETESCQGASHSFCINRGDRYLELAASSEKERVRWLQDLGAAIKSAKNGDVIPEVPNWLSCDEAGDSMVDLSAESQDKTVMQHINTSVYVCWHRNISISRDDLLTSAKCTCSGFLLRKFKDSSSWQKLWVVLSNLCLFLYKSFEDKKPLGSLPLAGYRVLPPSEDDAISKDYVFKLQYKNHNYFFRSENQYVCDRWMEAVHFCTLSGEEKTRL